jgi:uncharacterized membrane protein YkgB
MHLTPAIVLGLAILACVFARLPDNTKQAWSVRLNAWHALIGVIAVILAFLILLNPEFLALGLLGDTAFFDLLVLLIGLQLRTVGAQAWDCASRALSRILSRILCWPSLTYLLVLSIFTVVGDVVSTAQKFVHRICS